MTGTRLGGLKACLKNIEREPNFYQRIGHLGGSVSCKKGFALNPELAKIAGAKGGRNGKRGPAKRHD